MESVTTQSINPSPHPCVSDATKKAHSTESHCQQAPLKSSDHAHELSEHDRRDAAALLGICGRLHSYFGYHTLVIPLVLHLVTLNVIRTYASAALIRSIKKVKPI